MDIFKEWSKGENGPDVDHVPLLLSNAVPKVSNLILNWGWGFGSF